MVQVSSIFGQILRFFPRTVFDAAVHKHQGDKHAKGMTCLGQFIALMSVTSPGRGLCGRSPEDWRPAKES
jgi:Domain of unknown function (DUF4372)